MAIHFGDLPGTPAAVDPAGKAVEVDNAKPPSATRRILVFPWFALAEDAGQQAPSERVFWTRRVRYTTFIIFPPDQLHELATIYSELPDNSSPGSPVHISVTAFIEVTSLATPRVSAAATVISPCNATPAAGNEYHHFIYSTSTGTPSRATLRRPI
jgi:hypothetical protein